MNKKLITKLAAMILLSAMPFMTMAYSIPVEDTFNGNTSSETFDILQGEKDGIVKGDYYLGTTKEHYTWGVQPDKDAAPGLRITSGSTVTIDTLSHEGMLED